MEKENKYGNCDRCGDSLKPAWFIEYEYEKDGHIMYRTGRKRKAVDYLFCKRCLEKYCVDDSFDGSWY